MCKWIWIIQDCINYIYKNKTFNFNSLDYCSESEVLDTVNIKQPLPVNSLKRPLIYVCGETGLNYNSFIENMHCLETKTLNSRTSSEEVKETRTCVCQTILIFGSYLLSVSCISKSSSHEWQIIWWLSSYLLCVYLQNKLTYTCCPFARSEEVKYVNA